MFKLGRAQIASSKNRTAKNAKNNNRTVCVVLKHSASVFKDVRFLDEKKNIIVIIIIILPTIFYGYPKSPVFFNIKRVFWSGDIMYVI